MILLVILLTLFISSSSVQAQELTLYQGNPVVSRSPSHLFITQPFALKEDTRFFMWYTDVVSPGLSRIVRVQSVNGIDWYNATDTNVTERKAASDPFVFKNNDQYHLYFASSNNGPISIWKSVSTDGISFSPGQEKQILTPQQLWEQNSVSCPALIQDQSTTYLFYAGSGPSVWAIGMATSTDGETWQKCANNPIISQGAGPQVVKYNNTFYLYFQSSRGFEVQQTTVLNGCNTVWTNRHVINNIPLKDPAPLIVESNLWIYGNLEVSGSTHIGLATNTPISPPSYPIVIIPGMFASWNKDAVLHNSDVSFDTWKLNPAVSEYEALQKTLENKGRIKNTDYFVFAYDWRAPLMTTVNNLNQFLQNTIWNSHPYQPVQIVGHSLGGTITRLYAQKKDTSLIKNIVTAGSPLLGTPQAYKPLAGGEIDRENNLMWMAEKLILLLNKSQLESDKDTITRMLPVLKDITPLFPYLKNEGGSFIQSSLVNSTLSNTQVNSSVKQLYLGGSGYQVNAGYTLAARTPLDILTNIYPDGHPVSSWKEDGDGIILLKSTLNQITPAPSSNHGEIIYSKNNIKTILSSLGIQAEDSDIPLGTGTQIVPAILAFIQSPATIAIEHDGVTLNENDGMIWIQNAGNGTYKLSSTGVGNGEYTVSIWLIGSSTDQWIQYKKTATDGSRDLFTITFNTETGGSVEEYIAPSPTPTITPTSIPTPTTIPTPTNKPAPTIKPSPTPRLLPPKPAPSKWIRAIIFVINFIFRDLKKK